MDNRAHTPTSFFSSLWWAVTTSIVVTTIITIWAELVPSFKTWLAGTFVHHWIGKSVIALILFGVVILIGSVWRKPTTFSHVGQRIRLTAWVTILSSAVLFGYFLWHALA